MKCPKCKKESCKYDNRENKTFQVNPKHKKTRSVKINNKASCKYCGWKGEI